MVLLGDQGLSLPVTGHKEGLCEYEARNSLLAKTVVGKKKSLGWTDSTPAKIQTVDSGVTPYTRYSCIRKGW